MADLSRTEAAILIGVWGTFALDAYSTLCSSPQTAEINIGTREESLMYWVKWGAVFGVSGGAAATVISGKPWPLVGAASVSVVLWLMYKHAKQRGKDRAGESGTESSGGSGNLWGS